MRKIISAFLIVFALGALTLPLAGCGHCPENTKFRVGCTN